MTPVEAMDDLLCRWHERDRRLSLRREPLTFDEVIAVKTYRLSEARDLDGFYREEALIMALRWTPPRLERRRR